MKSLGQQQQAGRAEFGNEFSVSSAASCSKHCGPWQFSPEQSSQIRTEDREDRKEWESLSHFVLFAALV
jgi:hypothetical protein